MEKKLGKIPVTTLAVAMAVVTFVLRRVQLLTQLDQSGKIMAGAGKGPLTWICLAVVLLSGVYSFFITKRDTMGIDSPAAVVLTLLAAFLMAMGSAAELQSNMVFGMGGLISALCFVVIALQRKQGSQPNGILFMVPALVWALKLIIQFRDWSRDPLILDYCFELLSVITVMCATFHLGGFGLGKGRRRLSVFYCLCGVIFGATAMADGGLVSMLSVLGCVLWLLANLWLLLSEE